MSYSLLLITLVAILGAAAGVWLTSVQAISRRIVPFSGGMLIGVALFWVLPEMAEGLGWTAAVAWGASGFALLAVIDRYLHPVCPGCEHDPSAVTGEATLRGFAAPLLIAAALHSTLDGWSVAAAHSASRFGATLGVGIAFHKFPEGLALGAIARAVLPSRSAALAWCALAESATLLGGGIESALAPHLDVQILRILLAIAAGSFLFLGGHAVREEVERSGRTPALLPALTGIAGSSILRLFIS